ncbi:MULTISPECIES: 4-hydroxy-tetrahydrodipicolinate synthase [Exiguobacterium]|uniref:4-hydroxy-tetrahydrodipicolinate synthase n=1 Tax=Exiguobacterium TaxID=33986 RepID=UPI0008776A2C|nr:MULTISPECIES: 4-hydroxy-tetrahydrodipicolinate synthase [Exiguobacterium]OGX78616.1 4-hydroxy-tetrahydrodipicolinate synthase [Exiguobacterium sp. SH31]TCI35159.1 4-hydroxy-tetrahydrodipicolinate synthase [Exiguobacterium sp. SH4S7]TCI44705.1 4-hydroxy-tetrahydrodipicolinate synthase [Exiguobacterium sp. SH5S32]TCI51112.1 4-hydroxy-tetrahydrodipicolinate synthase [Exiguobacterium sp. SH1S4]TCI59855.1 4-hydroxy-tetrahydrodipicolinate synthase [Exiguobacterium sp. SH0S2]
MFTGVATALATPFQTDGQLNLTAWEALIEDQIKEGVSGLVIGGTTGEGMTITDEEFETLLTKAIEVAAGRAVIIAGTGSNNTALSITKTKRAAELGAEMAMVVTPYYNKSTQAGLIAHFTAIADASPIPLMLYNVPSRTGVALDPATVGELAEHPQIAALKEASGDISVMAQMMAHLPEGFPVYCGNDDQILPYMAWGAQGVVSVLSNVYPGATVALAEALLAGDLETARTWQIRLLPVIDELFAEVNPIPVKAALNARGFEFGSPRLPLVPMSATAEARLLSAMEQFNEVRQ